MPVFRELKHLPDFVKWSHTIFAMPFALGALILAASGWPGWSRLILVIFAVAAARTSAMAFNRIVDRHWDARNPRTADRHLPSGKISLSTAWVITLVSASLFAVVAACLNRQALYLSPIALLVIWGYSLSKRFTHFSHFILGLALGLAPVGAWLVMRDDLMSIEPWMMALAVMLWVAGFDMIYSLQDLSFDRETGLHSMPVWLGERAVRILVPLLHLSMLGILVLLGWKMHLSLGYVLGMILVAAGVLWAQLLVCRSGKRNLQGLLLAANGLSSFGFLVAVILDRVVRS